MLYFGFGFVLNELCYGIGYIEGMTELRELGAKKGFVSQERTVVNPCSGVGIGLWFGY